MLNTLNLQNVKYMLIKRVKKNFTYQDLFSSL